MIAIMSKVAIGCVAESPGGASQGSALPAAGPVSGSAGLLVVAG